MVSYDLSRVVYANWPAWQSLAKGLFILFLLYHIALTIKQHRRLRHIKGPFLTGVSKWWFLRAILRSQSHLETTAVNTKYGPIARIAPNDVVVSDLDMMKQVLAVGSKYSRSSWYNSLRFDPFKDNVLSTRDETLHTAYRAKLAPGYSGRDVKGLEAQVDETVSKFITFLGKRASSQERLDLAAKVAYFTLDMISQVAFGNAFGFLETDSDLDNYVETTRSFVPLVAISTVVESLVFIRTSRLFAALFPVERMALSQYKVMKIAKQTAANRFGPERVIQQDMIGSFVAHGLSQEELEGELTLTLLAGGETTALAIRMTIFYLISNPLVLARLRAEIDIVEIPRNSLAIIPEAMVRELPYLQAVIKESLRIIPPVTGYFTKESPPEGTDLMGTFIPGGTRISINLWGLLRQKSIWGEDAEEFRPDRWLNVEPEGLKRMTTAVDMVFSYGKYQCLGKAIAQKVLLKTIFEVMRQFDLTLCYPMAPMKSIHWLTFNQKDLWVRAYRRAES